MWLLSPLTWLLIGVVLAALAAAARRPVWLVVGTALAAIALALMTPLGGNALIAIAESRVPAADAGCGVPQAVVLLSGGLDRTPVDRDDFAALTDDSLRRAFAFARRQPDARLPVLVSGGGPFEVPEAEVIASLLERLGIDRRGLVLESSSRSTWQNAIEVRALLPDDVRTVVLASSALHLPRAALAFHHAGFDVCPQPLVSWHLDVAGIGAWLPQRSALAKSEAVLYEWAGELYYRLRMAR